MLSLVECKADVEARDKVGSGRGFRLRICVREGEEGVPMRAVQGRGKSAECAVAREHSWISVAWFSVYHNNNESALIKSE